MSIAGRITKEAADTRARARDVIAEAMSSIQRLADDPLADTNARTVAKRELGHLRAIWDAINNPGGGRG